MYHNIGRKIKGLAVFLAILGSVGCLVVGALMIEGGNQLLSFAGAGQYGYNDGVNYIGLAVIILGPIISWLNSFVLYGFGELIAQQQEAAQTAARIETQLGNMVKALLSIPDSAPAPAPPKPTTWTCPACGNVNEFAKTSCPKCGKHRPVEL